MSRFHRYAPEQSYLLPPNVAEELGEGHLAFHVHRVVEGLDVSEFERAYGREGRLAYPPRMMLKVWLYAFCLGLTSTRRLEQRVREDLPLRYLAGSLKPDHKTLSEFLRRHRRAINDVFTQVLEMARRAGMAKLGHVAIDSTRVQANAARSSVVEAGQLERDQRAWDRRKVRMFQQKALAPDPNEGGGTSLGLAEAEQFQRQMENAGEGLAPLPKQGRGRNQVSLTDPDSRFLRTRDGWTLGYTADLAVSEDHFILATRITQQATDNGSLVPMIEQVQHHCRATPEKVSADSGFFSGKVLEFLDQKGIDGYLPDNNLKHELDTGEVAHGIGRSPIRNPQHQRMREKLRTQPGRNTYRRRQAIVEPVFGILKQQRNLRRFLRRGLANVQTEWMWAVIAYNIGRMRKA
jgi:transposase